jgi:hypothetical protein
VAKCSAKAFCKGITELCEQWPSKGLVVAEYVSMETGDFSSRFLGYKYDGKRRGKWTALNFCPICGTDLIKIYKAEGWVAEANAE